MDDVNPEASTLVVKDGIIHAVTTKNAPVKLKGEIKIIDMAGKTILPGIIDSHVHVL